MKKGHDRLVCIFFCFASLRGVLMGAVSLTTDLG